MKTQKVKLLFCLCCFILLPVAGFALDSYRGKVVEIKDGDLLVRNRDGKIAAFDLGMTTKYVPDRKPKTGENVRVEYEPKKSFFSKKVVYSAKKVTIYEYQVDTELTGEVTVGESGANIRSGPGSTYQVVAVVAVGEKILLQGESEGWYRVFLPEKNLVTGWIYSSLVVLDSNLECSSSDCPPAMPVYSPNLFPSDDKPASF